MTSRFRPRGGKWCRVIFLAAPLKVFFAHQPAREVFAVVSYLRELRGRCGLMYGGHSGRLEPRTCVYGMRESGVSDLVKKCK